MEFNPNNAVVKSCLRGMELEDKDNPEEATQIFLQAWNEATNDLEKFITAHYVARHQKNVADRLKWLQTALELGLHINDDSVQPAFPPLFTSIARCYNELNDPERAKKYDELANSFSRQPTDVGPFYHGTKADLMLGDFLKPGFHSNYKDDLTMNHIYFTAIINGAGLAAALAKGQGRERVYMVEPTGTFEDDPNVTNKKFPGNLTRSYRTDAPLKIIGEVTDYLSLSPMERQKWREKLANNKGKIIN